jgi:hypothetical protein
MKSTLMLWHDVKAGTLPAEKALKVLEKMPGGKDTQTYRRIVRFKKAEK